MINPMRNRTTRRMAGLVLISLICVAVAVSSFRSMNRMNLEFNEKKAVLVREALDLKDKIDQAEKNITAKNKGMEELEKKFEEARKELEEITVKNSRMMTTYTVRIDELERLNSELEDKVASLLDTTIEQYLKNYAETETDPAMKALIARTLSNIELVRGGKQARLDPIVVSASSPETSHENSSGLSGGLKGVVLSTDLKNNLLVTNLGRKDGVGEQTTCIISRDGQELARGYVISARYRLSAVYINEIKYGRKITDIKEGDSVDAGSF